MPRRRYCAGSSIIRMRRYLHLAPISFKADRTCFRNLHRFLEELTVAGRACDAVFHGDLEIVPVLRAIMLQLGVGTGEQVVPALQLRPAHVDPLSALGVARNCRRRTKFFGNSAVVQIFWMRRPPGGL